MLKYGITLWWKFVPFCKNHVWINPVNLKLNNSLLSWSLCIRNTLQLFYLLPFRYYKCCIKICVQKKYKTKYWSCDIVQDISFFKYIVSNGRHFETVKFILPIDEPDQNLRQIFCLKIWFKTNPSVWLLKWPLPTLSHAHCLTQTNLFFIFPK